MNKKRHLVVAALGVLVLLEGLVFGTWIFAASGVGSSSKMIEHTGQIVGSILFKITAPTEAYPNEPSYVKIEVYQPVPSPAYIDFIKATVRYSWTLGPETIVENKYLTGNETLSVTKTFDLSGTHEPKPTYLGNHIRCDLEFSIHDYSFNLTGRDVLTFSLGLVTEKTGEAGEGCPISTQILIYCLVGTTVLFMATTAYFARRKPKVKLERKTT